MQSCKHERSARYQAGSTPGLPFTGTEPAYPNDSLDISDNVVVIASDQVATADDHVNLGSAVGDALLGLGDLSCSWRRPKGLMQEVMPTPEPSSSA